MERRQPRKVRVLIANDPRSYREAIAEAIRELKPDAEVIVAEPGELEEAVQSLLPDMVICSEAIKVVRDHVSVWVELYPQHGSTSTVGIRGEGCSIVQDMQLADLLALVERARRLAQQS